MKSRKGFANSKTTVISIIILDIILMTLFLYFSKQILDDFKETSEFSILAISSFVLVIPGTLFILIIIQIINTYKQKLKPGNSFKKNIVFYYIITVGLVFISQSLLALNFFETSTNNWLSKEVVTAVDIGFSNALNQENSRKKEIENLGNSKFFISVLKNIYNDQDVSIDELQKLNASISCVELFNNSGKRLIIIGDYQFSTEILNLEKVNFFYPQKSSSSYEYVKYQFMIKVENESIYAILTSTLPDNFSKNGFILTKVKNELENLNSQKFKYSIGIFIFYLLFTIPIVFIAILGSFIFSDEIIKPIADIEEAIRKVALGNYSYRILSKKKNEFNLLITSFNKMIKEVERSRTKLKHTEQISTWQDIATRLAHEIKNPLTPIKLSAQRVLLKEKNNSIIPKHMETIINEVTRMERLLNEFRDFARFPNLNQEYVSIQSTILDSINIYKSTYPDVIFDVSEVVDFDVFIDKNQMIQVISNLTINGIHAMNSKGILKYSSEIIFKKDQTFCKIRIIDTGHGISKDVLPNIFKPYFTTKYDGSGLGLAIVNKIIIDHKGKIWIESAENVGTTFYFEFPKEEI
ncbi:MAG: HAMP domain-containing histidine kinase [Spirochaetales bacterium]|nr:HAMP domain-containing histidine kinase [Spirochaetales bacterium]